MVAALGALSLAPPAPAQEATLAPLADRCRRGDREAALGDVGLWTAERTQREVDDPPPSGSPAGGQAQHPHVRPAADPGFREVLAPDLPLPLA